MRALSRWLASFSQASFSQASFSQASILRALFALALAALSCGPKPPPKTSDPAATQTLPSVETANKAAPSGVQLHLASSVWAPFTDVDGKPHVALDVVHEALHRSNVGFDTKILDFADAIEGIREARFDGSEALWKTAEREKFLLYSDAYLENRLVLLARVGTDVSAKKLADLAGKKVGLVRSYAYGPEVDGVSGVDFARNADEPTNLKALLKGELDYILVDELVVHRLFADQKEKAELLLTAGQTPILIRGLHFGLRKDLPGAAEIIASFNQAILALARDGTYNHLLGVNWIAADTDQDGNPELVAHGKQVGAAPPAQHYRIAGSTTTTAPHFVIEGRTYEDWQSVPEAYKVPPKEGIERFQPALNVVLLEF
jgi:polar amino acid transport system substrate-binding protein